MKGVLKPLKLLFLQITIKIVYDIKPLWFINITSWKILEQKSQFASLLFTTLLLPHFVIKCTLNQTEKGSDRLTLYVPLGRKNGDGIGACVLCKYEFCCKNPLMEFGDACK